VRGKKKREREGNFVELLENAQLREKKKKKLTTLSRKRGERGLQPFFPAPRLSKKKKKKKEKRS